MTSLELGLAITIFGMVGGLAGFIGKRLLNRMDKLEEEAHESKMADAQRVTWVENKTMTDNMIKDGLNGFELKMWREGRFHSKLEKGDK